MVSDEICRCASTVFCFGVFKCFVKFWSFLDFVKQAETGGGGALSATPPKWLNGFQWNFPEFFYTYCRFGPPILFWFFKIVCQILVIFGLCQTSWKGGGWALSATPPKWLNRFQWNFPKFFYTYCRCAPLILFLDYFIFCQIVVNFGLCQTSWNWGGGHYPQLLLNGWIDFNETFQNSFTHIADLHLLFCFGFF